MSRAQPHETPECVAARQGSADNISKETLQYHIPDANDSNVYSNQEHNRAGEGGGGGLEWCAGRSFMGLWFLMVLTGSQTDLTHLRQLCSPQKIMGLFVLCAATWRLFFFSSFFSSSTMYEYVHTCTLTLTDNCHFCHFTFPGPAKQLCPSI